ncbi:MAG: response regulator [Pleurocapsa sp.]
MPVETRRILLVNCDPGIKEMIQLCLETIPNCKVIIVNSNIEAIERASARQISAILLDLDEISADLSWSEIIKDLKQNQFTNSIPLILLTHTPQAKEIVKLQQAKGIKAIAKSFNLLSLASQLSVLLGWN